MYLWHNNIKKKKNNSTFRFVKQYIFIYNHKYKTVMLIYYVYEKVTEYNSRIMNIYTILKN